MILPGIFALLFCHPMTWEEVVADPDLQHLRYKIETNELGQIVMSPPPSYFHQESESEIVFLLRTLLPDGKAVQECPVKTPGGTKVADAAWISRERRRQQGPRRAALTIAPEICVEVVSPSNTLGELLARRDLYFAAGALEFWICDEDGGMTFFNAAGELERSGLCPEFPRKLEND